MKSVFQAINSTIPDDSYVQAAQEIFELELRIASVSDKE